MIFTLAGSRSRWTMPFSWAASSASGNLAGDGEGVGQADALSIRRARGRDDLSQRGARDELHDKVVGPNVEQRADTWMVEGGNRRRFAARSAR